MSQDKLSMTLDDIIKTRKTIKSEGKPKQGGAKKGPTNKGPARGAANRRSFPTKNIRGAAAGARKTGPGGIRKNAPVAGIRRGPAGKRVNLAGFKSVNNAAVTPATKKLVQKLVKNALRKRANITTPVAIRKRGGVAASTLAARRQGGVVRRAFRPQVQQVIQQARPAPVQVVREIITAPPQPRRVIQAPQRTVIVERVVAAPQQRQIQVPRRQIIQAAPRRQFVQAPRRQVIREEIIRQPARQRIQRVQQVIQRVRPQQQRVVQRVVRQQQPIQRVRPQQQVIQVVRQPQGQNRGFRKNDRFRNAIQGGGRREQVSRPVIREVQRFQPVSYVTERIVSRRGRGFQGRDF